MKIDHEEVGVRSVLRGRGSPREPGVRELSGAERLRTLSGPPGDGVYHIKYHYSLVFVRVCTPSCRLHTFQGFEKVALKPRQPQKDRV